MLTVTGQPVIPTKRKDSYQPTEKAAVAKRQRSRAEDDEDSDGEGSVEDSDEDLPEENDIGNVEIDEDSLLEIQDDNGDSDADDDSDHSPKALSGLKPNIFRLEPTAPVTEDTTWKPNIDFMTPQAKESITQFDRRIKGIISSLKDICSHKISEAGGWDNYWMQHSAYSTEAPMYSANMSILINCEPEYLVSDILKGISKSTRAVLGRDNLTFSDLLSLPAISPLQRKDAGTYIHTALRSLASDSDSSHTFGRTTIDGQDYEGGLYTGSSAAKGPDYRGMWGRNKIHREVIHGRRMDKVTTGGVSKSRHYQFMKRRGVLFRISPIATYPLYSQTGHAMARLSEAIMMVYFNTVVERVSKRHCQAAIDLISAARARVPGLPNFLAFGLNLTWNFEQEGVKVPRAIIDQPCSICNEPLAPYRQRVGDIFGARICKVHYRLRARQSLVWIAKGPCVRCHRPREMYHSHFVGSGELSECGSCRGRLLSLERKGKPIPTVEEDAKAHSGCGNCGLPEWWTTKVYIRPQKTVRSVVRFWNWGKNRRCDFCDFWIMLWGEERPESEWYVSLHTCYIVGCSTDTCYIGITNPMMITPSTDPA